MVLQLLPAFMPRPEEKPRREILAMFYISLLFDKLISLLWNGSVVDIGKRITLYEALLQVLTIFAQHPHLAGLLWENRNEKKQSPGLQVLAKIETLTNFWLIDPRMARCQVSMQLAKIPIHKLSCTWISRQKCESGRWAAW
jgi:hypothetical protein